MERGGGIQKEKQGAYRFMLFRETNQEIRSKGDTEQNSREGLRDEREECPDEKGGENQWGGSATNPS